MHFYKSDDKVIVVQNIASAPTVISSVVQEVRRIVLNMFPKHYFKYDNVSTRMAILDHNRNDSYNSTVDKIPYPSISFSPEITLEDAIALGRYPLLSDTNLYIQKNPNGRYKHVVSDPDSKFDIYTSSDYITVNNYVSIKVKSFQAAMRAAYYLKSRLAQGPVYDNNKYIDVELPKTFVKLITELKGFGGVNNAPEIYETDLALFDNYMTSICKTDTRIRAKKDLSTGKWCFFYGNSVNMLMIFADLNVPNQVIRESQSEGEYEITFRVQTSLRMPNAFMFYINTSTMTQALNKNRSLKSQLTTSADDNTNGAFYTIEPIKVKTDFKDTRWFLASDGKEWVGHNIIHQRYTYDIEHSISSLDLSQILKEHVVTLHSYGMQNNLDITQLLAVEVESDTAYTVDYDNLLVIFDEAIHSDFVLNVWINRSLVELLEEQMTSGKSFFLNDAAMTTADIDYYDYDTDSSVQAKVKIYRFQSDAEMEDTDINKSFRIKTIYGIGYFGLVPEGHESASPYKVCVGMDDFGNPIIRCLELV